MIVYLDFSRCLPRGSTAGVDVRLDLPILIFFKPRLSGYPFIDFFHLGRHGDEKGLLRVMLGCFQLMPKSMVSPGECDTERLEVAFDGRCA